jgi:hypothetical protein
MIEKKWNLKQMEKRIENLKKVCGESMVLFLYLHALDKTDDKLDALYLTFYALKSLRLRYKREVYGVINNVDYKPKLDWDRYSNEYWSVHSDDWSSTPVTYTYSYSTYYNML